jgi:hypothetical protein
MTGTPAPLYVRTLVNLALCGLSASAAAQTAPLPSPSLGASTVSPGEQNASQAGPAVQLPLVQVQGTTTTVWARPTLHPRGSCSESA